MRFIIYIIYIYMEKIIIFVHTCHKYEESRAKKIENTWGGCKENVIFITDNPHSSLKNNIYIGKYKKGLTYHPKNLIKMFNIFIKKYNHYDWFMIIDDDSYLYTNKLIQYLKFQDKDDCLMIGDFMNWTNKRDRELTYDFWVAGGPGIVFTKKCIIIFLELMNKYKGPLSNHDKWLHDLFLSSDKKMIKRIHCCGFHQYLNSHLVNRKIQSLSENLLISIHLNGNMDSLYLFHNLIKK
jgi:hypothetical protein